MSDPPFWNLWDLCGTLLVLGVLAFLVCLLGGLPFLYVVLIVVLLLAAAHFAKGGDGK